MLLSNVPSVFRMLAYGVSADSTDEYVKIGESMVLEALKRFCRAIVEVFGERYLRTPNANDVARLLQIGEQRGFPGSNNDINVLETSHLFANLAAGTAPPANYVINGKSYDMGYYLADEACRKDVKRAFGVLQSRFAIVAGPARLWRKEILHDIMTSCIIMHNMIFEDERDVNAPILERQEVPDVGVERVDDNNSGLEEFLAQHKKIKDKNALFEL
ncbi:hypothetical protein OSB04_001952 [Centaurea solstitialis]|uniref:DDE Tnp4 domain-containing protein n=1 Tax=Centaurea solstitialis TaxID=347529 RepID=A0AA38WV50_9ASTR|nr:hypothetical protein OSB04_001952 [Centaurea solstitialis]